MALATQFPEIDPVALLQLVEAPVVRMAFYEFRHRFWDEATEPGQAMIPRSELTKTLQIFEQKPSGFGGAGHRGLLGGGLSSHPFMQPSETAFSAFLSRVYAWAQQEHLKLPIASSLRDSAIRAKLLWGILGVCISLHAVGEFPAPLAPFPESDDDILKWEAAVTGSLGYDPTWYRSWQEWRIRHELLQDQTERYALTRLWVARVAEDFSSLGEDSGAREAEEFLGILRYVKSYDDLPKAGDYKTRHLYIYEDKESAASPVSGASPMLLTAPPPSNSATFLLNFSSLSS
ncbi:hypothetical protein F5B18DRAFT_653560 [Nemania serpens]|nr:hypothetical protein F5B18DRAFT_653560 [Nemania serpens]